MDIYTTLTNIGIIPACAGNSYYIVSKGMAVWDHPRVCGEQMPRMESTAKAAGSSPRVRGTVPQGTLLHA